MCVVALQRLVQQLYQQWREHSLGRDCCGCFQCTESDTRLHTQDHWPVSGSYLVAGIRFLGHFIMAVQPEPLQRSKTYLQRQRNIL